MSDGLHRQNEMNIPTPETDKLYEDGDPEDRMEWSPPTGTRWRNFAGRLEREREELRAENHVLRQLLLGMVGEDYYPSEGGNPRYSLCFGGPYSESPEAAVQAAIDEMKGNIQQ